MTNIPENECVVLDLAGNRAKVKCRLPNMESVLSSLGFIRENDLMTRRIVDDSDRQALVRELIALEALFASGRDWSPSELVGYYRERGVVSQSFRVIAWENPDCYAISVVGDQ
jgi:hypothetical protein